MGLLSGTASITRFRVSSRPGEPDFDRAAFRGIEPGSQVRERAGFVPFEPGAEYRIGHARWAFRVRVDRLKPDPTLVAERLKELLVAEREATGQPTVPARRRKTLKQQAEEELLVSATPRSKVIECVLDGEVVYVGTTANAWLGIVLGLLREVGIVAGLSTPWLDSGEEEVESEIVPVRQPWQSVRGCRFLRGLLADPDVVVEPESGGATLATRDARVSLAGDVVHELHRYLERDAELLSVKLVLEDAGFRLDGLNWRLSGLRVSCDSHRSWQDTLHERIGAFEGVFESLEGRYETGARMGRAAGGSATVTPFPGRGGSG